MGLMDEVVAESNPPRRGKMDEIKEKLSKEDCQDFLDALVDTRISQMALVRALQRRGIHIGKGTISEMRRDFIRDNGGHDDAA
jgi:hypothetical protein